MKTLPLKRSSEYKERVRHYALNLKKRYRKEVAVKFLEDLKYAEGQIFNDCEIGTAAPYVLAGQDVILRELYFYSGPATYCIIFTIFNDCVGLISLWHGRGSRSDDDMSRIWPKGRRFTP